MNGGVIFGIIIVLAGIGLGMWTMHKSDNFRVFMKALWDSIVMVVKPLLRKTWFRATVAGVLIFLGGYLVVASMLADSVMGG